MKKMDCLTILPSFPLFLSANGDDLGFALADARSVLVKFRDGQPVCSRGGAKQLGIIIKGAATVYKPSGGHRLPLNELRTGSCFGASQLFYEGSGFTTYIAADPECTVLFIEQSLLKELFQRDFSLAENYLGYLAERIVFLNRKLDSFTRGSGLGRLAMHLVQNAKPDADGSVFTPDYSLKELAERLGIGRASLYRAIGELQAQGIIERRSKTIAIKDMAALRKLSS